MNMETVLPYLKYVGLGLLALLGVLLVLWLGLVFVMMKRTKGIPIAVDQFFRYMAQNQIDQAYQMTSANYQKKVTKSAFLKLIKVNKFKTNTKTMLSLPSGDPESNSEEMKVTVVLNSGKEIPTRIKLVKDNQDWLVEDLVILN